MINKTATILFDFFKKQCISYRLFEHQPLFTVYDQPIVTAINGIVATNENIPKPHFKTLFLKDKDSKFFLISVTEDKRVDLKTLRETLGCGRLSFGNAEELLELMTLTPGSVTPLGLIFDQENKITFALDEDTLSNQFVSFHPMINNMTVVLTVDNFMNCMEKLNHKPIIIKIPTQPKENNYG